MTGTNPIDRVVDHIASATFETLPEEVVSKAKTFLLDSLGVGIAGSAGAGIDALKTTAAQWGDGDEATAWVTGERLPAMQAAIINAYQIHCLEFDCVHEGAVVHPMATMLSAVLAWAERSSKRGQPVSGADLITALAVGVDVAAALGMASNAPIRFFRPATAGGFGATAAIGKLAGFGKEQLKDALGAMYGQTSGTMQPHAEGSMLLGLQIGFNARGAIAACDLAAAGIRGPHDILTGRYGYLNLFEMGNFDLDPVLDLLGTEWQIARLSHKPFPSGRLTHGAVDGLGRLMSEHGFTADDIASIRCEVPSLVANLVGRPDVPEPGANYAKLCLPFVVGVFLARGRVDLPDFASPTALADPQVHAYAARVDVEDDGNPDPNALDPQRVRVRLKNGSDVDISLPYVYGHPDAPLNHGANVEKFRRCCSYGVSPLPVEHIEALIKTVDSVESEADIAKLARLTLVDG
ncbi:MAG: MmgE/PrpD family protein [Pseudomonadota bacterium]